MSFLETAEKWTAQPQRVVPVAPAWREGLIVAVVPALAPRAGSSVKVQGIAWTSSSAVVTVAVPARTVQDFTLSALVDMDASGYATAVSLESSGFSNTLAIMGRVFPSQKLGAQIAFSDVDFAYTWQPGPAVLTLTRIGSTAYVDVNGVEVYTGAIDSSSATIDKLKLLAKTDSNLDPPGNGWAAFAAAWHIPRTVAQRRQLTLTGCWQVFDKRARRSFRAAASGSTVAARYYFDMIGGGRFGG